MGLDNGMACLNVKAIKWIKLIIVPAIMFKKYSWH